MLPGLLDDERSLRIGQTLNNQINQPKLFIMKKAAFFAVMLAFVSLLGFSYAGAPVRSYMVSKVTGVSLQELNSPVSFQLQKDDDLTRKCLVSDGQHVDIEEYSYWADITEVDGIEIGFDFPMGYKTMKYFGVTGSGLVFFSPTEKIGAMMDYGMQSADLADYVQFGILTDYSDEYGASFSPARSLVGDQTAISYQVIEDALYISFENVLIEPEGAEDKIFTISYQYKFSSSGEISVVFDSLVPAEGIKQSLVFALGLVTDRNDGVFLKDWEGTSATNGNRKPSLTSSAHPEKGDAYTFVFPAPCEPLEDAAVTSWELGGVTENEISFGYDMAWTGSYPALFILSKEAELSGENLPQNGMVYTSSSQIGSSVAVAVGSFNTYSEYYTLLPDRITGLEPGTDYYLHAYIYDDMCADGPIYVNPSVQKVTTVMGHPEVSVTAYDKTSLSVKIEKARLSTGSMIAVGKKNITSYGELGIESGSRFETGDILEFKDFTDSCQLVVVNPYTEETEVVLDELDPASPYYIYVWAVDNDGYIYSGSPAYIQDRTLSEVPSYIDFVQEPKDMLPAGWYMSEESGRSFKVTELDGADNIFALEMSALDEEEQKGVDYLAELYSPVFSLGTAEKAVFGLNMKFFNYSWGSFENAGLQEGDSVVFEYSKEDSWIGFMKVDYTTAVEYLHGNQPMESLAISPEKDFRVRMRVYSVEDSWSSLYFGISRLSVEPYLDCKNVVDLMVVEDAVYDHKATVKWTAGSEGSLRYDLRMRADGAEQWINVGSVQETEAIVWDLLPDSVFHVEVTAVCGEDEFSMPRSVQVNTLKTLPFALETDEYDQLPSYVGVYKGILSDEGDTEMTVPGSYDNGVWGFTQSSDRKRNSFGIQYMSAEDCSWLLLPALSSQMSGVANLSFEIQSYKYFFEGNTNPDFGEKDSLYIFKSHDGTFSRMTEKVASIALNSLTKDSTMMDFDFRVDDRFQLALCVMINSTEDEKPEMYLNALFMDQFKLEWKQIDCSPVSRIRVEELTNESVRLSWFGTGVEYAVAYRAKGQSESDTLYVEGMEADITGLMPETTYEYQVWAYCEPGRQEPTEASDWAEFTTLKGCLVPQVSVVEGSVTWRGAEFLIESMAKTNDVNVFAKNQDSYPDANYMYRNVEGDTWKVDNLYEVLNEVYCVRVRSVCASDDTSAWSLPVEFTTLPMPECGTPSDLQSEVDLDARTAKLSWKKGVNNQLTSLFVRESGQEDYDSVATVDNDAYLMKDIQLNTVYEWKLTAFCEEYNYSNEAESSFDTKDPDVHVEGDDFAARLNVLVSSDQIVVENPSHLSIRSMDIMGVDGRVIARYPVNSRENVLVYTRLSQGVVLVRILGDANQVATYKLVVL